MIYADEDRVPFDGRTARVICARGREGAITGGPGYLRFETMEGDCSYEDRNRVPPPKRAYMTPEETGNEDRFDARITIYGGLLVEPGLPLKENLYTVVTQENAYPRDGKSWRPPPLELGLVAIGRTAKRADGVTVGVKDPATGRPYLDEFLELKAHRLDAAGNAVVAGRIRALQPFQRGKRFNFGVAWRAADLLKLTVNGVVQDELSIESGYPRELYRSPYPALGVYQHPMQVPVAVRHYDWREAPHA